MEIRSAGTASISGKKKPASSVGVLDVQLTQCLLSQQLRHPHTIAGRTGALRPLSREYWRVDTNVGMIHNCQSIEQAATFQQTNFVYESQDFRCVSQPNVAYVFSDCRLLKKQKKEKNR